MARIDSSYTAVMLARQFKVFMSTVRKEFGDLKAEMKAENTKLAESIKTASDEMAIKMEVANKSLSDSPTKQFKDENKILRKEFSSELKAESLTLTEVMNQLRKDTNPKIASLNRSVEAVRKQLNKEVNEHKGVVQRQVDKFSQELDKRTRDLSTELKGQITQAKEGVAAVRHEMVQLGEQVNSKVTDEMRIVSESTVDCKNQIVTEKENNSVIQCLWYIVVRKTQTVC
jgi:hypothetical protein